MHIEPVKLIRISKKRSEKDRHKHCDSAFRKVHSISLQSFRINYKFGN